MSIRTIKGFDHNLCCRGKQYEVGKTYEEEGELRICGHGMHAVSPDVPPLTVFGYYPPVVDGQRCRYCEVVLDGEIVKNDDKVAALKMTVVRELTMDDLQEWCKKWADEHGESKEAGDGSSLSGGYRSSLSGGDGSSLSGGYRSSLSGGDHSSLSGGYGSSLSGGYGSSLSGGDDSSLSGGDGSSLSGGYGSSLSGGDHSSLSGGDHSSLSGGYGSSLSGGYGSVAASRGSASVGRHGVAVARSEEARVRGKMGALLVVAIEDYGSYALKEWKAGVVDGVTLKADTWYTVENGEWKEVPDEQ